MARRNLIGVEALLLLGCYALVISSAAGEFYGHPYDEVLRRTLKEAKSKSNKSNQNSNIKSNSSSPSPPTSPSSSSSNGRQIFDITQYGAVPNNDKKNNVQAFMKTWVAACKSTAPAKMVIPAGSFLVGPVVFQGPCKSSSPIIIEVIGTVLATTDVSEYSSPEWFSFEHINGLVLTGTGTFDGQGPKVWKYNDCKTNPDCTKLAASLKFQHLNNVIIDGITSLNAKWFHFFIYGSKNVTLNDVKVIAPDESPNTDGIHFSATSSATVTNVPIQTGDDCVAIGQDTHDILIQNVTCGPGHGISIGSLGKWAWDKSVSKIHVKNCTLTGSSNGARIKTWGGKTSGTASGIIFEDIIMHNVKNPIIIDQNYGGKKQPSKWQISDVHFKNIKGTSVSKVSVSLGCSPLFPCDVELVDIDLEYAGPKYKTAQTDSICSNTKLERFGSSNPQPCNSKLAATMSVTENDDV